MKWFINMLESSVGKKLMMAVTGFGFVLFLAGHLAGNLTLFGGKSAFLNYAEHLHSLGPLVTVAEFGLLFMALIHISVGLTLFLQNRKARPVRYKVDKRAGGRTLGSSTMPYTGILLLAFIITHLLNFHFVDKSRLNIFDIVSGTFSNPLYVAGYIFAMVVAAIHVSHGFWSAFQTMGLNHGKYMPLIKTAGIVFALAVGIGFGSLPIVVSIIS